MPSPCTIDTVSITVPCHCEAACGRGNLVQAVRITHVGDGVLDVPKQLHFQYDFGAIRRVTDAVRYGCNYDSACNGTLGRLRALPAADTASKKE